MVLAKTASRIALTLLLLGAAPAWAQNAWVKVDWTAPTTNVDGSALTDLAGYRVYIRQASTPDASCPPSGAFFFVTAAGPAPAPNTTVTRYYSAGVVGGVTNYVRVTAVDIAGNIGACGPEASTIPQPPAPVTGTSVSPWP
jgi:hypothetical protein